MGNKLRRLGVYGANLPTKKNRTVVSSDFLIGGTVGLFERAYDKAFEVKNPTQFKEIFGEHVSSSNYGNDAVEGFFNNVVGVDSTLYVSSYVGYTGSAIDGVTAYAELDDQQGVPEKILKLEAAYETELEYGISGNRTGYTIELADRFTTAFETATIAGATTAVLDSVADIKIGDIVKMVMTGAAGITEYRKITNVEESTRTITWSGGATGASQIDDVVTVLGFKLRVWRKNIKGIVTEVDEELGKVICTTESEVTDYYVQNVFASSKWVKVTRQTTTPSSIEETLPAAVATTTYLTSGAAGTTPTTASHWNRALTRLDNLPVRMICNPETTTEAIQKAMETYCKGRDDNPKVIFNISSNQTKSQLITIGNNFQRSDDVLGVIVAHWLKITDPFSNSTISPDREIPNVGHIMGMWIRSIGTNGIHFIPALKSNPIYGINDIVGTQFTNDDDRTDIAEAGANLIEEIVGSGFVVRNFFTPSTTTEFMFANGILQREFIKISAVDSLQETENSPNSLNRISNDRMAILTFLYDLWERGSTGNVPTGETFGQFLDEEGVDTRPEDHFEVIADLTNNPQSSINNGERNFDIYFTYPAPAGSIKIGVGFILR